MLAQLPEWAEPAAWSDPVIHTGPSTPRQFYGGDLDGVREHLDHLVDLGISLLYLTPVFPARSNHRYDALSFDHVDPLLGGDEALVALVSSRARRGAQGDRRPHDEPLGGCPRMVPRRVREPGRCRECLLPVARRGPDRLRVVARPQEPAQVQLELPRAAASVHRRARLGRRPVPRSRRSRSTAGASTSRT